MAQLPRLGWYKPHFQTYFFEDCAMQRWCPYLLPKPPKSGFNLQKKKQIHNTDASCRLILGRGSVYKWNLEEIPTIIKVGRLSRSPRKWNDINSFLNGRKYISNGFSWGEITHPTSMSYFTPVRTGRCPPSSWFLSTRAFLEAWNCIQHHSNANPSV